MLDAAQIIGVFLAGAAGAGTFLKFFAEKIISAGFEKARHKDQLFGDAEFAFRQRQLEELYGPIYAYLRLSAKIYPLWIEGRLQEVNVDVIRLFAQQNAAITTILRTKAHLIDGSEYPPEFTQFMTSATIWGMYCTRDNEPWLPAKLAELEEIKWPTQFETYIFQKTEELKRRLDELLHQHRFSQ